MYRLDDRRCGENSPAVQLKRIGTWDCLFGFGDAAMKTLYLCGAGNSEGVRLASHINRDYAFWNRIVLLDDDKSKHGGTLIDVDIEGTIDWLASVDPLSSAVVNLVARTTAKRQSVRARLLAFGIPFASLIHPGVDTEGAEVATDAVVYHNATIGPEVSIGDGSVIFMGAIVGHECEVGQCCVVAANAVLNARVRLGEGVYVGANATVLPEISIGKGATIGAGSVVIQDVPDGATVMGVPAQIIAGVNQQDLPDAANRSGRREGSIISSAAAESAIRAIWEVALKKTGFGASENFFDLGGTSLLAIQVHGEIQRSIHREFPVVDLFRFPTLQSLASHLGMQPGRDQPSSKRISRTEIRKARIARRAS